MRGTTHRRGAIRFLTALGCVFAAAGATPPSALWSSRADAARALLRSGHTQEAIDQAILADRAEPGRAETAVLLGDIHFRKSDFGAASRFYEKALVIDPRSADGHAGNARIHQLQFRRNAARTSFATAFRIRPHVPEIVRAYASVLGDRAMRIGLLQRYLSLATARPREEVAAVLHDLEFYRKLGDRRLGLIDGAYRPYRLRVRSWRPRPGAALALLVSVEINGGKPLSLIFDTGASGIYISGKAAEKLNLEHLSNSGAHGPGRTGFILTEKMLADTVRMGELTLRNVVVDVTDRAVVDNADGVFGAQLLERFLLRLDAANNILDLIPYEGYEGLSPWEAQDRAPGTSPEGWIPVAGLGHLLLVPTQWGGPESGYLVLDTGASYTCISPSGPAVGRSKVAMAAAGRGLINGFRSDQLRFRIGEQELTERNILTLDLRDMSNREGVEISGLLGYSAVRGSTLTINYRDGLIRIEPTR